QVVPAALGLGAALAVGRAAHVDDVRVGGADVVDVDAELAADGGQEVGQEDVRLRDQPEQYLPAAGRGHVQPHALLTAVGNLDHVVHPTAAGHQPGADQPALRVPGLGMLDLDDLGAPLGQDGAGHRHVRPGRDLDDLHTVQDGCHAGPP